jgi:glycosyltransferase involved in cell wall biosynthesis
VSVVICAKNDAYNLKTKLPTILEQEYPNFEVVVVNDDSLDDTSYVLRVLQEIYPNLNVITLKENINKFLGKKYPLSIGIRSAKNEIILLTESDTIPTSYNWISEMVKGFTKNKDIVIGYTKTESKNNFLNSLIQYESQTIAMNYLGHGLIKNPYMGLGRNLAFTKKMFFSVNGFIPLYNIQVGEHELFVNKFSTKKNTSVIISKDSINQSVPKERVEDWLLQKKKHYRIVSYFKLKDKIITSLIPSTTFLLYCLIVTSLVFGFPWEYGIMGLFLKYTLQIIINYKSSRVLQSQQLAFLTPIYEILFLPFNTIIKISALLTKKEKWKY